MYKALILSDKPILRKKDEESLLENNIEVTTSIHYNEDLFKSFYKNFDLVVLNDDFRGVDIRNSCRAFRTSTRTFIILLGHRDDNEMTEKQKDIGFHRYYQSGIRPRELATRIKILLSQRDSSKKAYIRPGEEPKETEGITILKHSHSDYDPACQTDTEVSRKESLDLWQNPKIVSLVSDLLSGRISQVTPEIDLLQQDGFTYTEADNIMGTSGRATFQILESLAEEKILLKKDFDTILSTRGGSVQLVPVRRCPVCDYSSLSKGKLIEHFFCGYVGLEEEFICGMKHVCPKCRKELKLIGTDYRIPGLRYSCHNCHEVFPSPTVKYRCLKTGEVFDLEALDSVSLCSYKLNEVQRERLEFELEPKKQLVEYLLRLGYEVHESARLQGRSGATHPIDLIADFDDPIARHTVAVGILTTSETEEEVSIGSLFAFDSKIYDIGIDHKIVIAVPRLTSEAANFAKRQNIRVYAVEELRALISAKTDSEDSIMDYDAESNLPKAEIDLENDELDHKGLIIKLLKKNGYKVTENAVIMGRSGARHILEFHAKRDDGITNHQLAVCIIKNDEKTGDNGNTCDNVTNRVVQFDTAAYDVGITDKVIVAVPRLSKAAKQFAEYQRIRIIEAQDLAGFIEKSRKMAEETELVESK